MSAPDTSQRTSGATARSRILVTAALVVAALYFLLPVYWLIVSASKSTADLFGTFGLWFSGDFRLFANIAEVVTYNDGAFPRWALNSVIYAVVGATFSMLFSAAAGYGLAKFHFRGREALFAVILGGVLIPGTALAIPLYLVLSQVGLSNTYWGVLLPSMVSPFGVFLCRIYAQAAIPDELLEAARVDGAGEWRIFASVAFRVMTPVLVTVFLFELVSIWNNFILPLVMLADTDLYPITVGLSSWYSTAERAPELYQLTVGGAFLSVIPLMIAMVVLQRFWRLDITSGGVKA